MLRFLSNEQEDTFYCHLVVNNLLGELWREAGHAEVTAETD